MATMVRMVCLDSADAVDVGDRGEHVFELPRLESDAQITRISMTSAELPMSQYPIEADSNRLHFFDGLRLDQHTRRIAIEETPIGGAVPVTTELVFPVHLNRVVRVTVVPADPTSPTLKTATTELAVTTELEHGLQLAACTPCWWVGSPIGDHELCSSSSHVALAAVIDERTVRVRLASPPCAELTNALAELTRHDLGYIHAELVPGPRQWASVLDQALRGRDTMCAYSVECDESRACLVFHTLTGRTGRPLTTHHTHEVRVRGDRLCSALGLQHAGLVLGNSHNLLTGKSVNSVLSILSAQPVQSAVRSEHPEQPSPRARFAGTCFASEWPYLELPPGWYGPSLRPASCAPPRHIAQQLTKSWNPLHFDDLLETAAPETCVSPYMLPFTDTDGDRRCVAVPCGTYSATSLCAYLSAAMTQLSPAGASVRVAYCTNTKRFCMECAPVDPLGSAFAVDFTHSALDPDRLGFARAEYSGAFVSERPVHVPQVDMTRSAGTCSVSDIGCERKLRFCARARPMLTCVCLNTLNLNTLNLNEVDINAPNLNKVEAGDALVLRTLRPRLNSNALFPFAHGYSEGDIVVVMVRPERVELPTLNNTLSGHDASAGPWQPGRVVADSADSTRAWRGLAVVSVAQSRETDNCDRPWTLVLRVPVACCKAMRAAGPAACLRVCPFEQPRPSLCFPGPECASVPRWCVGFPSDTRSPILYAWQPGREWPLVTPNAYRLELPDYLLVYVEPCNSPPLRGTLRHTSGFPLAKVIVAPQIRDGAVRSESVSVVSIRGGRFVVRITNPDGSPYRLHGAPFSLTLQLIGSA